MKLFGIKLFSLLLLGLLSVNVTAAEPLWIDVRSVAEHQADSIAGHLNVPHTDIAKYVTKLGVDKKTTINLYCRSGGRAGMAKQVLVSMGYSQVSNIGGIAHARQQLAGEGEQQSQKKASDSQ